MPRLLTGFALLLLAAPTARAGLIVNGDFESGNAGFSTQFTYSPAGIGNGGTYAIVDDPTFSHVAPPFPGDHTTGSGMMMAVNGSHQTGALVWSQTVAVEANAHYDFSAWVANWAVRPPVELEFVFNGQSVGTFTGPAPTGIWTEFAATWHSGNYTSVTISIIERNPIAQEVGFALDDITLTGPDPTAVPVPPTAILGLFGFAGLAGWGLARRRVPHR